MTARVAGYNRLTFLVILVAALGARSARGQSVYVENFQTWSAVNPDAWEPQSLAGSPYNVPAGAVVEIAVRNTNTGNERSGGVRAFGSGLDRRLFIQEAEAGGANFLVMHVQTDASSRIEHYSDVIADVQFILLGYWRCGTYVERFDTFTAGASAAWTPRNLAPFGVAASDVAEIVMSNDDTGLEREAGVRTNGSGLARLVDLQEAEAGGRSLATMFANADATVNATVGLYAEDDADVDFFLVGYWTNAPGTFTELFTNVGGPAASATWEDESVAAAGVPANSVLEMVLANGDVDEESNMGARKNGSTNVRLFNMQEAEAGGRSVGRMHVRVDAGQNIEVYHRNPADVPFEFNVTGYWSISAWYSVTDLGSLTGDPSLADRINASGQIAGFDEDASTDDESAWRYSGGALTGLGTLGGTSSEGRGINAAGKVAGWAHNGSGNRRAFLWTSGVGMTDLGILSGLTDSEAFAVNSSDEVVGTSLNFGAPSTGQLAFLYLPSTAYGLPSGMNSLGTLGGGGSVGLDVNDSGQVVGGAQIAGGDMQPFMWLPAAAYGLSAGINSLGTLGGSSDAVVHRAHAINGSGEVVGLSYTAGGAQHAFLWLPSATYGLSAGMNDLGALSSGTTSWAFGINSSPVIVGTSNWSGAGYRAFLWETGSMTDLNDLIGTGTGWTLLRATGINASGQIVGWGTNGGGSVRGFLLTPSCFVTTLLPADQQPPAEQTGAAVQPFACGAMPCGAGTIPALAVLLTSLAPVMKRRRHRVPRARVRSGVTKARASQRGRGRAGTHPPEFGVFE